ncbi:hypothetical protein O1611_g656 [Lasiodiplodia mahajangana]|uniref:Uncharacterized protein n=1 Tax=Lasiodiplodia mahajangana TaxID=1108764 RepID=A0ACC2K0L4_9PEZI|nr:hypothetical protein O1611_g656 [Lasiodiplodia mahajangana]
MLIFETPGEMAALAVVFGACFLTYLAYTWALPKPIPGIPYNKEATTNLFGDIPSLFAFIAKTGEPPLAWMLQQSQQLQSPIIQVFVRPFAQPRVVLCDFREGQDILMRRKDFDRSPTMGDLFSGLVPHHHIHQSTNAIWKSNRRLLQDLMSPKFLNNVAGPVIHRNALNLIRLWHSKAALAGGRPFDGSEDIYHAALDAVLAFSFGETFPHSAISPNLALLEGMNHSQREQLQESSVNADKPVTFPQAPHDDAIAATLGLATVIEDIQESVVPRWKWWLKEKTTSLSSLIKMRNTYIEKELRNAVTRAERGDTDASEVRSAVDLMVHRETILAAKEGRQPAFLSQTMRDEAFGFVVAGHDTTSTTILWALKFLADTPPVQDRVRSALQRGFPDAWAEKRDPSIREITSTVIPYLDATMEEILRCSGTVPGVDRQAIQDTELLGHRIPKGTIVIMLGQGPSMRSAAFDIDEHSRSESCQASKMNGKGRAWDTDDMADFNPDRWLTEKTTPEGKTGLEFDATAGPQLAFGLGTRGCFGKRLAYLELRILLSLIVWNFRLQKCPADLSSYGQKAGITHKPHQCYHAMDETTKPANTQYDGAQLQTQEHRELLDVIDSLRSQGIDRYVDLPQIIVCGDQSSGKSSVLEAISGLSFPTKDNLCTRFATELILRRNPVVGLKVSIIPSHDRSEVEKQRLKAFEYRQVSLNLSEVVEAAKRTMGLDGSHNVFSKDTLRVEVSGPTQPHLTMVDLPGLFSAGNKDQSTADAELVQDLVLSYMEQPRSVILAVVSAKNDFALQQVTRHAHNLDPKGIRTLGLITKPDTLDVGSDSEKYYVDLAQNKDVIFRLGWHVLRNRSYITRDASTVERDRMEAEFFSTGVWTALNSTQLGVKSLRARLSNVLYNQIVTQLPSVLENVETGIGECETRLSKLGAARSTAEEQRRYLFRISRSFTNIVQASIDGNYTDAFFANMDTANRYPKRLRAVVQNTLLDFAEKMHIYGHARIIQEEEEGYDEESDEEYEGEERYEASVVSDIRCVSRTKYIEEVRDIMKESRGRELPGTYNPLIVAELFSKQCKPWENLVLDLGDRVLQSAEVAIDAALDYVADEETAAAITRTIIVPSMDQLKRGLRAKLDEMLHPHLSGHPITYNHYLTENVQKAQAARNRRAIKKQLVRFLGRNSWNGVGPFHFNPVSLLDSLESNTEPDMDTYSCSIAIDMMEAYYKVALKTLIDDVSVLAIERCLIQKLPQLLPPDKIYDLTDEQVRLMAGESESSAVERERLNKKLWVLQRGLTQLGKFKGRIASMTPTNFGPSRGRGLSGHEAKANSPRSLHNSLSNQVSPVAKVRARIVPRITPSP